jgi:two-component system chemotaxis response regulator CheY
LPSVLIADDAAFMRMMLRNILTGAGYEVAGEAEDGAEAVSRYRELRPDLTTMDITMPGMNGLEALKAIRAEDPEARVIMCSAMGQKSMVVESFSAGARDFIVKPFQADRVVSAMEKALL